MTEKSKTWLYIALMMTLLWETGTQVWNFFTLKMIDWLLDWKFDVKILTTTEVIQKNVLEGGGGREVLPPPQE